MGFETLSPGQRVLMAGIGGLTNWSRRTSPEERRRLTQPARDARRRQFERQVDPDGVLPPEELAAAVDRARKAHFRAMALKSAQVRADRAAEAKEERDAVAPAPRLNQSRKD